MHYEINAIIERLQSVTGTHNDYQLTTFLDLPKSSVGSWRKQIKPPFEACIKAAMRTGVDPIWILTGMEQEEHDAFDLNKIASEYKVYQMALYESLRLGFALGYLKKTDKTEEAKEVISRLGYAKFRDIDLEDADNPLDLAVNKSKF